MAPKKPRKRNRRATIEKKIEVLDKIRKLRPTNLDQFCKELGLGTSMVWRWRQNESGIRSSSKQKKNAGVRTKFAPEKAKVLAWAIAETNSGRYVDLFKMREFVMTHVTSLLRDIRSYPAQCISVCRLFREISPQLEQHKILEVPIKLEVENTGAEPDYKLLYVHQDKNSFADCSRKDVWERYSVDKCVCHGMFLAIVVHSCCVAWLTLLLQVCVMSTARTGVQNMTVSMLFATLARVVAIGCLKTLCYRVPKCSRPQTEATDCALFKIFRRRL